MRCALLVAFVAILGCGKPAPAPAPVPAPPDPVVARREGHVQAAFQFDAACAAIESAQGGAKDLALRADGEAKEALLNVVAMLDSAGASLADHVEEPPPLDAYRKAEPAGEREKAVADAQDALQALHDARDILEGLGANAPKPFGLVLAAAQADVGEAIDAVGNGIEGLGGEAPPEREN